MQESFWWWQCSDRYVISPLVLPHLHSPLPPFSPSLISLMVSVEVKAPCILTLLEFEVSWIFQELGLIDYNIMQRDEDDIFLMVFTANIWLLRQNLHWNLNIAVLKGCCRHRQHATVADHTTGIMTSVLLWPATALSRAWATVKRQMFSDANEPWPTTSHLSSKPCCITLVIILIVKYQWGCVF